MSIVPDCGRRYPAALREHAHTTKAYIPADVAKALLANPSLVQKAIETFYTRDAIQLRVSLQYICIDYLGT